MLLDKAQTERICDMSENPHHQDIIAVHKLGIGQISGAHPDAYNFSHTAVNSFYPLSSSLRAKKKVNVMTAQQNKCNLLGQILFWQGM